MPTDINILHQMIVDVAKHELQEHYDKWKVVLNEPKCSGSQVTITQTQQPCILCRDQPERFP